MKELRALRGQILDFLHKIYPREIEELGVISVFYQYYTDTEIRKSLQYLVDKGYVEMKEIGHPYHSRKKVRLYRLTAKGIDLLEKTIRDEAIVLEEED